MGMISELRSCKSPQSMRLTVAPIQSYEAHRLAMQYGIKQVVSDPYMKPQEYKLESINGE